MVISDMATACRTMTTKLPLLRLLQLASPTLPVGAFAYSQGLETAVERGWVTDETSAGAWIGGLLEHSLRPQDIPALARLYRAWETGDEHAVRRWNGWLYACRESRELQDEDRHLGAALARLLADLELPEAAPWRKARRVCFATPFSLAAARWGIPLRETATGYVWAWAENQIAAATKLVPLGQTAGQRLLSGMLEPLDQVVDRGLALADADMGGALPGLALAGGLHEVQYSRLFRS